MIGKFSTGRPRGSIYRTLFFAIRAQAEGQDPVARVLEGPIQAPHLQSHGYHPVAYGGLPRLAGATFHGQYPFAWLSFEDATLPVKVELEAFTPLIPLNPEDSGLPGAIFNFQVSNPLEQPVEIALVGSLFNPVGGLEGDRFRNLRLKPGVHSLNTFRQESELRGLFLQATGVAGDDLHFGSLSLSTDFHQVSAKPVWLRGAWWDFLREFWDDFVADGNLEDLGYDEPAADNRPDTGSLSLSDTLGPGETQTYRFILTWYFPNRLHSWKYTEEIDPEIAQPEHIRNHYAIRFDDAWQVARYMHTNYARLGGETHRFHDALFGSTLPPSVIDAISANIVPVRSNTCFWLEDGRFFGWEGCHDEAGCCAGSCTHVWSYAHTVAFLFPSLEREMRRIEFMHETDDSGYMTFRTFQTFAEEFNWAWGEQKPEAAVDGQMGSISTGLSRMATKRRSGLVESDLARHQTSHCLCRPALGHRWRYRPGWPSTQHL